MIVGGKDDPTTIRLGLEYEHHIVNLQRAAHARALKTVRERRAAIEAVATEMCESEDLILGHRIIDIIEASPIADKGGEAGTEEDEVRVN